MTGQSASDVASDDRFSDSLKSPRKCDGSDPSVAERAYRADDRRDYPKWKSDERLSDPAKTRRARDRINSSSMKRREESARNWLGRLVGKRRGVPALTFRYTVNQAVNQVQFRDSDNEASLTILDGPRRSASNPAESPVHDRDAEDASNQVPIDRSRSREPLRRLAQPARSRRDRNGVSFEAGLNADNLFAETPLVDHANERTNDYSAHRSSRGSRALNDDAGDRGIAGFWVARQTHSNTRGIYALDNRGGDTRRSADRLRGSDGIVINDVRNEFASANDSDVDAIAIDAAANDFDVGAASMENQVELDGISEIENRTDHAVNSGYAGAEIRPANCRDVACAKPSGGDDDTPVIRIKKYGTEEEEEESGGDRFMGKISTVPDNDTDVDVDGEAPFTGFEGSQKFPVKINRKSPPVPSQVEKFDRRHFGPHKEDVLEETSTWYWSTVPPDLPKSPSRDVPRRKTDGSDDVADEVDEADNGGEETTEVDANNTYGEPRLPVTDLPEDVRSPGIGSSPDEKLAVTSSVSEFQNATRGRNDSNGGTGIGVATTGAKPTEKINVTILGLFEMTHGALPRPEGSSELQAAKLAVERVNELDILKRFRLRLIYNDTKVSRPGGEISLRQFSTRESAFHF